MFEYRARELTEEIVREIRARSTGRRGEQSEMAREFGISQGSVWNILRGRSWTHVTSIGSSAQESGA